MIELKRVMLIDDDANIRDVAAIALEDVGGLIVEMAESGMAALAKIHDVQVDVILLDMMMPGMDGPTTMSEIRKAGITTPIIFMTAKVQPQEVAEYEKLGAAGLIMKPFDPMKLADDIRRIVNA